MTRQAPDVQRTGSGWDAADISARGRPALDGSEVRHEPAFEALGPMFADRDAAGRQLADRLAPRAGPATVVEALPRGGVIVAGAIAERLRAPLDIIVVRKIGCPWQPELGVGAIAEGGVSLLNRTLMTELSLDEGQLEAVIERERQELTRRAARYRAGRAARDVRGHTAIVVDDGLATGYTARVAIEALRRRKAEEVILAVPVGPDHELASLREVADEVVALETSAWFVAIGDFYEDFGQVSDEEVVAALAHASASLP